MKTEENMVKSFVKSSEVLYRPNIGRYDSGNGETSVSNCQSIDAEVCIDPTSIDTNSLMKTMGAQRRDASQDESSLPSFNHFEALKTTEDIVKWDSMRLEASIAKWTTRLDEISNNFNGSPRDSTQALPPRKEKYEKPFHEVQNSQETFLRENTRVEEEHLEAPEEEMNQKPLDEKDLSWEVPFRKGFLEKEPRKEPKEGEQNKETQVANPRDESAKTQERQGTEQATILDIDKMTRRDLAELLIGQSKYQNGVTEKTIALEIDEILHMPFPRKYIQSLQAQSQKVAPTRDEKKIVNGKEIETSNGKWCAQGFEEMKKPNEKESNKEKHQEDLRETIIPRGRIGCLHRSSTFVNADELEDSGKLYRPPVSVDSPTVSVNMPVDTDVSTRCIGRYKLTELGQNLKLDMATDMEEEKEPNTITRATFPIPSLKTTSSNDLSIGGEVSLVNERTAKILCRTILSNEEMNVSGNGSIMEYKAFLDLLEKSLHGKSNFEWKYEVLKGALKGMLDACYAYRVEVIPSLKTFIKHTLNDLQEAEMVFALHMPNKPKDTDPRGSEKNNVSTSHIELKEAYALDGYSPGCISFTTLGNDKKKKEHESSKCFNEKNKGYTSNEARKRIIPINVHFRSPTSKSNKRLTLEEPINELERIEKECGFITPGELCKDIVMSDEANLNEGENVNEYKAYVDLLDEILRMELFPKEKYLFLQKALEEMLTKPSILKEGNKLLPLKTFLSHFMENPQQALKALGMEEEVPLNEEESKGKPKKKAKHPPTLENFGAHKGPSSEETHGVPSSQTLSLHPLRLSDGTIRYENPSNTHSSPTTWNPKIPPSPNLPKDQC